MKTTIEQSHIEALVSLTTKAQKTIFLGGLKEEGRRIYSDTLIASTLETSLASVKFYVRADGSVRTENLNRKRTKKTNVHMPVVSEVADGINNLFSAIDDLDAQIEAKGLEIEALLQKKSQAEAQVELARQMFNRQNN